MKPKIAIFAAYKNGCELLDFAVHQGYPIEFVVTCDKDDSEYEEKIANICEGGLPKKLSQYEVGKWTPIPCFRKKSADEMIEEIKKQGIDIVFLVWWPSIIHKEAIEAAKIGWVNLHTSLLPYNRGMYPYYWAIAEETPFGATQHFVNEGIDNGDILFQKEIPIEITDTGETLYAKLIPTALNLFKENYHKIVNLQFEPKKQDEFVATAHLAKDIEPHSCIDLEKEYKAGDLINIIRARTFWKGNSAYFIKDGKKYLVRINISQE